MHTFVRRLFSMPLRCLQTHHLWITSPESKTFHIGFSNLFDGLVSSFVLSLMYPHEQRYFLLIRAFFSLCNLFILFIPLLFFSRFLSTPSNSPQNALAFTVLEDISCDWLPTSLARHVSLLLHQRPSLPPKPTPLSLQPFAIWFLTQEFNELCFS